MGRSIMQGVVALLGALVGATWQATHEAQTRTHELLSASWSDILLAAVVGGVGALVVVRGGLFLFELGCYRWSRSNERWRATGHIAGNGVQFALRRREDATHEPSSIHGVMECVVKGPSGVRTYPDGQIHSRGDGEVFVQWTGEPDGHYAGDYEVRWYGSARGKFFEITREAWSMHD